MNMYPQEMHAGPPWVTLTPLESLRRLGLPGLLLLLPACASSTSRPVPASLPSFALRATEDKPNLVFIIADDCTFRDMATYGGQAATPNIDRLAREGMKFSRCFQTAPMCSPTRHSIYTGLYPVKSGAYPNHTNAYPKVRSLHHYLEPLGYTTHLSGKTHIGPRTVFPFKYSSNKNNPDFEHLALDSWVVARWKTLYPRRKPTEPAIARHLAPYGRWRGLALWLLLTEHWYHYESWRDKFAL